MVTKLVLLLRLLEVDWSRFRTPILLAIIEAVVGPLKFPVNRPKGLALYPVTSASTMASMTQKQQPQIVTSSYVTPWITEQE